MGGGVGADMRIGVFGRDSDGFERVITGIRGVGASVGASIGCIIRLLDVVFAYSGCVATLFAFDFVLHEIQVFKILLLGSAEELLRKEERGSFFMQAEQYLESILALTVDKSSSVRYGS
jgi:hypothetical protein